MSVKYENVEELADWINTVFQKSPFFHPLTCVCGEYLTAKHDGVNIWLECQNHSLLGSYYQQVPDHIVELKHYYPFATKSSD